MKSLVKTVAITAALLALPTLALAGSGSAFKTTAPHGANSVVNPGLWFTIKNECSGAAYATVADNICLLQIGTATFMTKLHTGDVPKGYSDSFDICAASSGGDGEIMFVPAPGMSTDAVVVTVKPNSTVAVPQKFCK